MKPFVNGCQRCAYHDVESTKLLNGNIDGLFDLFLDPNVRLHRDSFYIRIPLGDQSRDRSGRLDIHIDQEDVRALRSEEQRGFQSDTAILKEEKNRIRGEDQGTGVMELRSSASYEGGLRAPELVAHRRVGMMDLTLFLRRSGMGNTEV